MPLWIAATLSAALFQTWRTALQQRLRGQLSVNGAGVVRYLYGIPFGLILLGAYCLLMGEAPPAILGWTFLLYAAIGGLTQIIGTNLLIMSFGPRGFAVGTAYSKTEAVQGAILALVLLGERISLLSTFGIVVGVCGVLYLSLAGRNMTGRELLRATVQPAALCGFGAGTGFAVTAIFIKAANLQLDHPDAVLRAITTLCVANAMQTVMQGAWLAWKEPEQFRAVFRTWRDSFPVGALSACGSACWFTGFALAPVAMVRALGQTEILFTLLFSRFYLKESLKRQEVLGALGIVAGVVLVLLGR
ncbi:EamA/RhaT family transporter [Pseudoroseomonas wenyumeiae]|jgi:drug/metabolite transporter (DMT)-like permease|uniref:EamA/RhaT family transporter n=1 Tax=Teichococcus wenyumeiae TaxID=2478470 RepID=A0A3A9JBB6_9PROT|nr:DMT family transporter [Pseudoroseomonas wenyumeiae]RKK03410.1 EamA/RhaT family transporter [Pseudoroseomonas wenyumeiae]RMI26601.1 EamA/RhaT family transporter [Pseudoroseomonas wenyumeiae]